MWRCDGALLVILIAFVLIWLLFVAEIYYCCFTGFVFWIAMVDFRMNANYRHEER